MSILPFPEPRGQDWTNKNNKNIELLLCFVRQKYQVHILKYMKSRLQRHLKQNIKSSLVNTYHIKKDKQIHVPLKHMASNLPTTVAIKEFKSFFFLF